LHDLRLHEAEDLGAEVLGTIAPADPPARDLPGAEMDALHRHGVDVHFVERARRRQLREIGAPDLERDVRARRTRGEGVRADGRADDVEERAEEDVVPESLHRLEALDEAPGDLLLVRAGALGTEARREALVQEPRALGV